MTEFAAGRRRFLATTALGGLGVLAARTAAAFTEQKMPAALHKELADRCSGVADPYHERLAAEAAAGLKGTMSDAEIQKAIAAIRCPICGCAVVASVPPAGTEAKAG
jgi:hypothetical protein